MTHYVTNQTNSQNAGALTFQVIAVGNESLVFLIRRTDFNGGWNQPLKVEILLVGGTKDVGETKD